MIYSYDECLKKYKTDYQIQKQINNHSLFKIEKGLYSDSDYEQEITIMIKKYTNAVFTLNSAFYYQGLTDTIPDRFYLQTSKDATKIKDKRVKQIFDNYSSMDIGVETITYNGYQIRVFSKERLLIELIRNRSKLSFDYYKEIIGNYRKIITNLDLQKIEEYADSLPKTKKVMETIKLEIL